jgi:hypothetical protein
MLAKKLVLSGTTNLSSFAAGDNISMVSTTAFADGTISYVDLATKTILTTFYGSSGWVTGNAIQNASKITTTQVPSITSTNAITATATEPEASWVTRTSGYAPGSQVSSVIYGNGVWVAQKLGQRNFSLDGGVTWSSPVAHPHNGYTGGCWGNGCFALPGFGGNAPLVIFSLNGQVWGQVQLSISSGGVNTTGVSYVNGEFVAMTTSGKIATSLNGFIWSFPSGPVDGGGTPVNILLSDAVQMVYAFGRYIAVGASGITSGRTFATFALRNSTFTATGVAYGNGKVIVCGNSTNVLTSTDGVTFSAVSTPLSLKGESIIFANGYFIIVGGGDLVYSEDGVTWTAGLAPLGTLGIGFGNGTFIAVGGNPRLQTSASPIPQTKLTIAGCDTDGFTAPMQVASDDGTVTGTITSVTATNVIVSPESAGWVAGQKLITGGAQIVSVTGDTVNLTSFKVPAANLQSNTSYNTRVRYTSGPTVTTSDWSPWSTFTTASNFTIPPGTFMNGGYFGGQIIYADQIYNLLVAPRAQGQYGGNVPQSVGNGFGVYSSGPGFGGAAITAAMDNPSFPAFYFTANLSLNGYTDWFMGDVGEMRIVSTYLKPTNQMNAVGSTPYIGVQGQVINAYPYLGGNTLFTPTTTTSPLFEISGSQSFTTSLAYWTATYASFASSIDFGNNAASSPRDVSRGNPTVRAMRKQLA